MQHDQNDHGTSLEFTAEELAFLDSLSEQVDGQEINQRKTERYNLVRDVELTAVDRMPIKGRTVDISRGGLRAVLDCVPEVGLHYAVAIQGLKAEPVRAIGRCLRVSLQKDDSAEVVLHFADELPRSEALD